MSIKVVVDLQINSMAICCQMWQLTVVPIATNITINSIFKSWFNCRWWSLRVVAHMSDYWMTQKLHWLTDWQETWNTHSYEIFKWYSNWVHYDCYFVYSWDFYGSKIELKRCCLLWQLHPSLFIVQIGRGVYFKDSLIDVVHIFVVLCPVVVYSSLTFIKC